MSGKTNIAYIWFILCETAWGEGGEFKGFS